MTTWFSQEDESDALPLIPCHCEEIVGYSEALKCYLGWKTMEIDGENWTQDIGYFLLFFLIFVQGFLVEKTTAVERPSHKSSRNDWMGYDHHQYVAETLQVLALQAKTFSWHMKGNMSKNPP